MLRSRVNSAHILLFIWAFLLIWNACDWHSFLQQSDFAEMKKCKQCWSFITELFCAVQHMEAVSHWVILVGFPVPVWKEESPYLWKVYFNTCLVWKYKFLQTFFSLRHIPRT